MHGLCMGGRKVLPDFFLNDLAKLIGELFFGLFKHSVKGGRRARFRSRAIAVSWRTGGRP